MPHSFIKNSFKKLLFFLFFFIVACSNTIKEISQYEINEIHCLNTYQKFFASDFITSNDENFITTISYLKYNKNLVGNYNLIVNAGPKGNSSYRMSFRKAVQKNGLISFYFDLFRPDVDTTALTVITYPMCLLYINDINNFDIEIIFS